MMRKHKRTHNLVVRLACHNKRINGLTAIAQKLAKGSEELRTADIIIAYNRNGLALMKTTHSILMDIASIIIDVKRGNLSETQKNRMTESVLPRLAALSIRLRDANERLAKALIELNSVPPLSEQDAQSSLLLN